MQFRIFASFRRVLRRVAERFQGPVFGPVLVGGDETPTAKVIPLRPHLTPRPPELYGAQTTPAPLISNNLISFRAPMIAVRSELSPQTMLMNLGGVGKRLVPRELFEVALRMEYGFVYECGPFKIEAMPPEHRLCLTLDDGKKIYLDRREVTLLVLKMEKDAPWQGVSPRPA
ncbi:MAG: hypothetical protein ACT4TC_03645 [Myxococcaceae bacterium]